jgi:hypothetical protein
VWGTFFNIKLKDKKMKIYDSHSSFTMKNYSNRKEITLFLKEKGIRVEIDSVFMKDYDMLNDN